MLQYDRNREEFRSEMKQIIICSFLVNKSLIQEDDERGLKLHKKKFSLSRLESICGEKLDDLTSL
jgi:hypothetical protein